LAGFCLSILSSPSSMIVRRSPILLDPQEDERKQIPSRTLRDPLSPMPSSCNFLSSHLLNGLECLGLGSHLGPHYALPIARYRSHRATRLISHCALVSRTGCSPHYTLFLSLRQFVIVYIRLVEGSHVCTHVEELDRLCTWSHYRAYTTHNPGFLSCRARHTMVYKPYAWSPSLSLFIACSFLV